MKKFGLSLICMFLLLTSFASAIDDASIIINIEYFDNYDFPGNPNNVPDMSDYIYVGNSEVPFGQGNVEIPLTQMGVPIVDAVSSPDVPGLHVRRGSDDIGAYVEITAYGFNDVQDREAVFYNFELVNSIINGITDLTVEAVNDGICDNTNAEYYFEQGGQEGFVCALTSSHLDGFKLYYILWDDNQISLTINIDFFANYDFPGNPNNVPDMSDYIYVGNSEVPFGQGNVEIPLTQMGVPIVDAVSSPDVPGLHVRRGSDDIGAYVEITAYGFNDVQDREAILFNVELDKSLITKIVNINFDNAQDGSCGVIPGQNPAGFSDDEYSAELPGTYAEFCSTTNTGEDRIRVYYVSLQGTEGFDYANWVLPSGEIIDGSNNEFYVGSTIVLWAETNFREGTIVSFEIFECDDLGIENYCRDVKSNENDEIRTIGLGNELKGRVNSNGIVYAVWTITQDDWNRGKNGIADSSPSSQEYVFRAIKGNELVDMKRLLNVYEEGSSNYDSLILNGLSIYPELPFEDKGNGEIFNVSFESNYYPLIITFELENENGEIAHRSESKSITGESELPVIYELPNNLRNGKYELFMIAKNVLGESLRIYVGEITIDGPSGGGKGKKNNNLDLEDSRFSVEQETQQLSGFTSEEEVIQLRDKKLSQGISLFVINVILLSILLILLLLILLIVFLRKQE